MENRIQEHRKRVNMTLHELGKAVGSSKAYIWQLERKPKPQIGVQLAWDISKALGAPIEDVFGLT